MSEEQTTVEQNNTDLAANEASQPQEESTSTTIATEPASKTEEGTETTDENQQKEVEKAPEKYEAFKYPENFTVDDSRLKTFTDWAKNHNLSQQTAQELIDMATETALMNSKTAETAVEAYKTEQAKLVNDMRLKWVEELQADPEFGGAKRQETEERAKRIVNKYGDMEALKPIFNTTGIGDNPALIKLFAKIDKALGEDQSVHGEPGTGGVEKTFAELMYPNQGKT